MFNSNKYDIHMFIPHVDIMNTLNINHPFVYDNLILYIAHKSLTSLRYHNMLNRRKKNIFLIMQIF